MSLSLHICLPFQLTDQVQNQFIIRKKFQVKDFNLCGMPLIVLCLKMGSRAFTVGTTPSSACISHEDWSRLINSAVKLSCGLYTGGKTNKKQNCFFLLRINEHWPPSHT